MNRTIACSILIPLWIFTAGSGLAVHHWALQRASVKNDSSVVNNIRYGLLSVDVWRTHIQEIVSGDKGEFTLSPEQEKDFKQIISNVLLALLNETDSLLQKRRKTLSEKIQKLVVTAFIDTSDLRKKIPALTQTIIQEMKKPANTARLKDLAQSQLESYSEQTFDNASDPSPLNRALVKYQSTSPEEFKKKTEEMIRTLDRRTAFASGAMLASLALYFLVWWGARQKTDLQRLLLSFGVGFALVFLATSVTTPMMEIDARINKLDIVVIGKHLVFQDQVLYYRNKSILQVVKTMLEVGDASSSLVGILILAFSILFPIFKLLSTQAHLYGGPEIKRNKWIHFFAFKSGKWSMADVMVVAMFMTYLGFSGLLKSQLQGLNVKTETLESISTSGTTLQPGFLLFVIFVLFGLFLSYELDRYEKSAELL